jgi:hypothetical protein
MGMSTTNGGHRSSNTGLTMQAQQPLNDTLADALSNGYRYAKSLGRSSTQPDEGARKALAEAALNLLRLATDPKEYLEQLAGNNQVLVCVRWLVHLNVLEHIPLTGSIQYDQLASTAEVPVAQLKSVARMAMTSGFLQEPELGVIAHSPFSALLVQDQGFMDWARFLTEYSVPSAYKFPEATTQWGTTEAKDQTAFSLAMNKQMPFFDYLGEEPGMAKVFANYMRNVASTEGIKFDHLLSGFDWNKLAPGSVVADVGGSRGHASVALAKKYPHLSFIVQDLPETIAGAEDAIRKDDSVVASRVKFVEHDFFGPQSVEADLYLLRMIIHDWPDNEAVKILRHLRGALKKPNARILIMDTVLPRPASIGAIEERKLRVRDLTMMQVFNAKERELEGWSQLLKNAGLQILSIRHPSGSAMSLLEVGLLEVETPVQVDRPVSSLQTGGSVEKPVVIIGAGIGGLCLAQGLQKAGVNFKVFERDPVIDHRPQGILYFSASPRSHSADIHDRLPAKDRGRRRRSTQDLSPRKRLRAFPAVGSCYNRRSDRLQPDQWLHHSEPRWKWPCRQPRAEGQRNR